MKARLGFCWLVVKHKITNSGCTPALVTCFDGSREIGLWIPAHVHYKAPRRKERKQGFTLIELSIVLVIIGLIVGGVMVGKDLIKSAEIRSVITDMDTYKTAYNTFKLKYNCIPGDCPNATDYFGVQDPTPAICQATESMGTLTCDGNGNGIIDIQYEYFRVWQQLAIAGLIRGKYTGATASGVGQAHILGVNAPNTAISGVGFGVFYFTTIGGTYLYKGNYGNIFVLGKTRIDSFPYNGAFTPAEALAIDQKIDDSKPATGFIMMQSVFNNAGVAWGNVNSCTTSINNTDYTGDYKTGVTILVCSLIIKLGL